MFLSRKLLVLAASVALVSVACGESSDNVEGSTSNLTGDGITPQEAQGADKVTRCHGTEPFWSVTIDPEKVAFKDADEITVMTIDNRGPIPAEGSLASFAALYQGRTKEDANRFLNVIITQTDTCTDGMSDEIFPYAVSVLSGNKHFTGCCSGKGK
mgnify:CR=1 FL=1